MNVRSGRHQRRAADVTHALRGGDLLPHPILLRRSRSYPTDPPFLCGNNPPVFPRLRNLRFLR